MASESSELTFVRCPSCRSLVPVSASRCRICNNPLDGGAKAGDGNAAKQGGRVRQKTISSSADELMSMESEDAGRVSVAPVSTTSQPAFGDEGDHEEVDPLADFLQEFESEAAQPVMSASPSPTESSVAAANDDDDDDDDDFDSFLDELDTYDPAVEAPAPKPAEIPLARPVEAPPLGAASPEDELGDFQGSADPLANFMTTEDDFDLDVALQSVVSVAPPEPAYAPEPTPPPPVRQVAPRPQIEKRPPAPPPQPQPQQRPQPQGKQARPAHEPKGHRDNQNNQPYQDRRENAPRDRGDSQRHEHRPEEHRKGAQNGGGRPHERSPERHPDRGPARAEAQASSGPKTGKMRPGRLFGWLVSFESPDGRAIELREGKFFVTGSSIRRTDLVIEDASISTPHALMSVSADHGLLIQDLMSERGVFVRPGERGQYKREDGVVELKHGDWVRFGDVEFLVTVVPSGQ
ncbi:MAG: Inner rane component of cytoplasmic domain [Pseudomonadota bacterium]